MIMAHAPTAIRSAIGRPHPGGRAAQRSPMRLLLAGILLAGCAGMLPPVWAKSSVQPGTTPEHKMALSHRARWIGVGVEGIPPVFGHLLGLKAGQGLLVVMVVDGSPAAKAGLIPGDLIVRVNDKKVVSPSQLVAAENRRVGGKIQACGLEVMRDGKTLSMKVDSQPRPHLVGSNLRAERLASQQQMTAIDAQNPASLPPAFGHVMRAAVPPMHAAAMAPMMPMTLTRRVDIYGYVHSAITYAGRTYRIAPSTVTTLPAPVQRMVRALLAEHVIELQKPPSRAQKVAILKARIAFLHRAEQQVQAELSRLVKRQSKPK